MAKKKISKKTSSSHTSAHKTAHHTAKKSSKSSHPAHKSHATHAAHSGAHTKTATKKNDSDMLKNVAIGVLIIALVAVLIWVFSGDNGATTSTVNSKGPVTAASTSTTIPADIVAAMNSLVDDDDFLGADDAPVVIVEFSDYQCPYCEKFWSGTLPALKEQFIDTGVVKFVYRDLPLSFHANAEIAAIAAECAGEQGMYYEYHDVLFQNQNALGESNLKKYAADIGLDVASFDACLSSPEMAAEVAKDAAAASAVGISGTPGFVINGEIVSGAQPIEAFREVICAQVPDVSACADYQPPAAEPDVFLPITVVTDSGCADCAAIVSSVNSRNSQLFTNATFTIVDASDSEGQELIEKYDLKMGPAFLFPDELTETNAVAASSALLQYFEETVDGWKLRDAAVGASWYFSEEDQAAEEARLAQLALAQAEALGVEKGDNRPQVDFFVMSYCPYGNQAEEQLKPVFDELKDVADFVPRYVIYANYNGGGDDYCLANGAYCSMHGIQELNQNIRELCVYEDQGAEEWFNFALAMNDACSSANADSCWTGVAEGLGYDTAAIQQCYDNNAVEYAKEQYELNQLLGVSGSPTVFFEGSQFGGSRSSNGYLAALCAGFEDAPEACSGTVEEAVQAVASGSC